jgi:hypothetical protein
MLNKPEPDIKNIYLIVDNLRIGGIQRLLLDEYYQFCEWGFLPKIICLSLPINEDHILNIDDGFTLLENIKIEFLPPNKVYQIRYFTKNIMRNRKPGVFISHSTSGAFVVKVSSIITLKKITLLLFIHQLLSLSSKSQTIKRVVYSLFATKILFSSKQFLLDWNKVIRNSNILRLLPIKPQEFVRMGVYLPRLCWHGWTKKQVCKENTPNLIFLSRPTRWKGFEKFLQISSSFTSTKICMLIFKPSLNNVNESNKFFNRKEHCHTLLDSGVTSVAINAKSVHIYPTDYGPKVQFPQSIGMNVLEMITQCIPSVISLENFESWPEFKNSVLVRPVDWDNPNSVLNEILTSMELSESVKQLEFERLSSVISISNHCSIIIQYSGLVTGENKNDF